MLAHVRVEGNEQADSGAKEAAEGGGEKAGLTYLQEASLSHLTRKTTGARSRTTSKWICCHVGQRHRYRPPKGGRMRKALSRTRKVLAGCFYQLLSGHAAVADHLVRVGQADRDSCLWCGSGERQTRFHPLSGVEGGSRRSRDYGGGYGWIAGGVGGAHRYAVTPLSLVPKHQVMSPVSK